jgi:hypothetical protein
MHTFWRSQADRWLATTDGRRAWALGVFCAALFLLVNWRNYHRDVVPLAFAPVSVWRHGTVDLDDFRPYYDALTPAERWAWAESPVNGHLYSEKSAFVSLLVAPFYLPPVLAGVPAERYDFWIAWGRLAAAGLTGLTVSLSYLTLRRGGGVMPATAFSLLLAFGTCLWTITGQTLYDHQAVLFVAVMAWLLRDFPLSPRRAFLAALAAGAAVVLRPVTVVLLFPVGLYLLLPGRLAGWRGYLAAFAGILPLPLLMAVANSLMFGHWYSTGYPPGEYRDRWLTWWPEGAAGLLIAPNSGLFVQSPFTLLAVVGGWAAWRSKGPLADRGLLRTYTLCFLTYWGLFAKWHDWQGGLTFTTRMLSEGYPLWMPLVMVGWERLRNHALARATVAAAGVYSVLYQLANLATFDATTPLNTLHLPWTPRDHFFIVHLTHFGAAATLKAVAVSALMFAACAAGLLLLLRPFLGPQAACGVATSAPPQAAAQPSEL